MSRRSQRLISKGYYGNENLSTSGVTLCTKTVTSHHTGKFRILEEKDSDSRHSPFGHSCPGYSVERSGLRESSASYGSNRRSTSVPLDDGTNIQPYWGKALMLVYWWLQTMASFPLDCLASLLCRLISSWKKVLSLMLVSGLFLFGVWYCYDVIENGFSGQQNTKVPDQEYAVYRKVYVARKSKLEQKELLAELLTKSELRSQVWNNEERLLKKQLRLEEQLTRMKEELKELQKVQQETTAKVESVPGMIQSNQEDHVKAIVDQALRLYSEDQTGLADYALESTGGKVLSTHCSDTYRTILFGAFGIPLLYYSQSPRAIIQPDVHPGNCWAFRGSQGFAMIKLAAKIRPTAITLEHIPKSTSVLGSISSAPRDFAVYGLENDADEEGTLLGQHTYNEAGNPIQTFLVETENVGTYQIIQLRILSNWGHPDYTCIYRVRVHGNPMK